MSVSKKVVSDHRVTIDHYMRQQHGILAEANVFIDYDVGTNMSVVSDLGRTMDHGCSMNSRIVFRRFVKQLDRLREREIWIFRTQHRAADCRKI